MERKATNLAGNFLRQCRTRAGQPLRKPSEATGHASQNIANWETGKARFHMDVVADLLAHYGVTWTQFGQYMDAQLGQGPERPEPTVDMSVADSFVARTRARIDADPDLRALYDRLTSGQTEHDERIARLESAVFRDC